jgi:prepilin peptidase CpaA
MIMPLHVALGLGPLLFLLLWAAAIDLRSRRIPNWLTLALIATGLFRSVAGLGGPGWSASLLGIFGGAAIPLILFVLGALGGGDVKLMAGIGAWLGTQAAVTIFIVECVVGGFIVLAQSIMQGKTRALFRNSAMLALSFTHQGVAATAETG